MLAELTFKAAVDFCKICREHDTNAALVNSLCNSGENSLMISFFDAFIKDNYPKNRKTVVKCSAYASESHSQLYSILETVMPDKLKKDRGGFSALLKRVFKRTPRKDKTEKTTPQAAQQPQTEQSRGPEKAKETTLPSARMEKLPKAPKDDTTKDT